MNANEQKCEIPNYSPQLLWSACGEVFLASALDAYIRLLSCWPADVHIVYTVGVE